MRCIFCKIIKGEIPSKKIYEDDYCVGILDISPRALGHTLVLPKEHAETVIDLSDMSASRALVAVKKITKALESALKPEGFTIGLNHKVGQDVPHVHIHIIPRWLNDGGGNIHSIINSPPGEELDKTAKKVSRAFEG